MVTDTWLDAVLVIDKDDFLWEDGPGGLPTFLYLDLGEKCERGSCKLGWTKGGPLNIGKTGDALEGDLRTGFTDKEELWELNGKWREFAADVRQVEEEVFLAREVDVFIKEDLEIDVESPWRDAVFAELVREDAKRKRNYILI